MEEMVSMHHRMPTELRQRLKIAAAQRGLAMTDIINQAIEMWLDQEFERMVDERVISGSIPAAVSALVNSEPELTHSLVRNLPKERIILISTALGADPDPRHSFGGLVNQLMLVIEEARGGQHTSVTAA
jgi:predicted DNA-binding protein